MTTQAARSASPLADSVRQNGFAIVEGVLDPGEPERLTQSLVVSLDTELALKRESSTYGGRDLLRRSPEIHRLAWSERLRSLASTVLNARAFPVRGLYFDKTAEANWSVPWHQDLTIAVRSRLEVPGFEAWTHKAGIDHVRAPSELLDRMVTLRVHLDDCLASNGPLRVIPGSHRGGRLDAGATTAWLAREPAWDCEVRAGGVVIMKPLILHASSPARTPGHRRVIHLEYASDPLPGGLAWYDGPEQEIQSDGESGS